MDLVAFATLIVLTLQWLTFEKTDETLRAQQRPWVNFEEVNFLAPLTYDGKNQWTSKIEFVLRNTGGSPALYLQVAPPKVIAYYGQDVRAIANDFRDHICKMLPDYGQPLFPKGRSLPQKPDISIDMKELQSGTKDGRQLILILIGCVNYRFAIHDHKAHQTGFVFKIQIDELKSPLREKNTPGSISLDDLHNSKFEVFPEGWYAN